MRTLKLAVSEESRQCNFFKKNHNKMDSIIKTKKSSVLWMLFAVICGLQFVFSNVLIANADINLTVSSGGAIKPSAPLPLHPYSYHQDFEDADPFQKWASNGTYTVNYKGLSTERSSSGKKSFKIDITFGTATYIYYKIPVNVPSVGKLDFNGMLQLTNVNGASASLGTNISLSPAPYSGVNILKSEKTASSKWISKTSNLVAAGNEKAEKLIAKYCVGATSNDVGIWTNLIGLYLYGKKGAKITVFVDDIVLSGAVPDVGEYNTLLINKWANYKSKTHNQLMADQSILKKHGVNIEDVMSSALSRGYAISSEHNVIKSKLEEILYENIIIYPWNPISNLQLLPTTYPLPVAPGNSISINACPGEFEPASFVIRSLKDLSDINISLTNLVDDDGNIIDSNRLDISLVKVWYQAGSNSIHQEDVRLLTPELLLHDDSLVKIDTTTQKNYLKLKVNESSEYIEISSSTSKLPEGVIIEDSKTLLPFGLNRNTNKQIYITAHIPEDAKSGLYKGIISISNAGKKLDTVKIEVNVLPFQLETPIVDYGLYYRGMLTKKVITSIGADYKTSDQYRIELNDMKDHGVLYPTLYQSRDDLALFKRYIEIRDEVGLPKDKIYVLATNAGNSDDPIKLKALEMRIRKWVEILKTYGYEEIFIYGIDEATGDKLLSQRKAWETVHKAGAKIIAATSVGSADLVGDILDLAVTSAGFNVQEIQKWKTHKTLVFSYANPQVGVENPEIYRKNYGLGLVCNGYNGAMNYAYQDGFNDIWNDFDHDKYRDHVFAYPTSNGVIRTIAWEGFREGVDDVRYFSTLLKRNNDITDDMVNEIRARLLSEESLDTLRVDIINDILSN